MSKDIPKYHISESAFPHYNCKTRSDQVFTSTYNSQLTPMSLQTALVTPRQSLTWNSGDNLASHHFNRRVNSPRLWRPSLSPVYSVEHLCDCLVPIFYLSLVLFTLHCQIVGHRIQTTIYFFICTL